MRAATRGRAALIGATLAIGVIAGTVPAGADGAVVATAAASVTPNPAFVANATDAVNPTLGAGAESTSSSMTARADRRWSAWESTAFRPVDRSAPTCTAT